MNAPRLDGGVVKADYEAMCGENDRNRFIACMDLGITGGYVPKIITITWKRGERVTKKRAEKLCDKLKDGLNQQENMDCCQVKLLKVYLA